MKFKTIGVKKNSVRVKSGIVTFDVIITQEDNTYRAHIPKNVFIANRDDYEAVIGATINEYINTSGKDNTAYEKDTNLRTDNRRY